MSSLDLVVLGIVLGSAVLGLMRGLIKEVFSLASWVLAFLSARMLGPMLAPLLPGSDSPALQHVAALVLVFVVVLVCAGLAGGLLSGVARWAGLGAFDRGLGVMFGALRGVAAVVGLALLAGLTALPKTQTWQASVTRPVLESSAQYVKPWLPGHVAALIHFS